MTAQQPLIPGFMIVHGNRLDELRDLAVVWMRRYPLRPLENEVVLVHSNGVAQWLKQALAEQPDESGGGGCGIAAAIDVQLPASFLWKAYRSVLGREQIPRVSLVDKGPLTWRLMRLLPQLLSGEAFAPLARFLAQDRELRKLYQLTERLADLFDQYQVYRADWLEDWAAGRDQLRLANGSVAPLGEEQRWQAELWRALLTDVGAEGLAQSRAGVHRQFIARLQELDQAPPGLPRRVIVFGISSLPAQALEALGALARFSQVLLCVHNPCRHHWADIVADKDLLRHQYRRQQRRARMPAELPPELLHQHAQPLLAAWGKQGRDYINLLDSYDNPDDYRALFPAERIDLFSEEQPTRLLGQLQDDILELRPLAETREHWPAVDPAQDRSLRFQMAHSAQREVEILHDQLLARFSADPSLRPRDVIVMVPDIDSYTPHIQAVFGQLERDDARFIPFTLADQGRRGREPLLIALEHLLELPDSRFAVSEILDLLDVPALRERFAIAEADLPLLHRWIEGAGVRWGLDAAQREQLGLPPGLEHNSWLFGLRRMLLGYAVGEGAPLGEIQPYDEIGGLDAALLGPLVELLERLRLAYAELARPATPVQWGERLRALLEVFFLPASDHDQLLHGQLLQSLEDWLEQCRNAALAEALPLSVVREAWLGSLDQPSLGQRFLSGAVNFCTLMPMRAIPFRLVCLLGMNDGDYPRAQPPLDFDLMGNDYRPGDRSRREDDRYLLLEALLSAREQLYISWVGRSVRDNSERPPSVLVGQLRDHLASGWRLAGAEHDEAALLNALTCEHPLQPFNAKYFTADSGLFSYAGEWLALHQQRAATASEPAALPDYEHGGTVSLEILQDFLRYPLRQFHRLRLKVYFEELQAPLADAESFDLDGLQRFGLSDSLLRAALTETDPDEAHARLDERAAQLQRSGLLPLAGFGDLQRKALLAPLPDLLQRYRALHALWPLEQESPLALRFSHESLLVEGWLAPLRQRADGSLLSLRLQANALTTKSGEYKWHHLMRPWVAHLIASAMGVPLHSALLASDGGVQLVPLPREQAEADLRALLDAWQANLQHPLPLAAKTACALLAASKPEKAEEQARSAYEGGHASPGERGESLDLRRHFADYASLVATDPEHQLWQRLYGPLVKAPWQALEESL
ncbi:exodeoxyribonuclease V subunit gamma [Pseudomonas sp. B392_1p]|uniref:exodeoxyribonuclease V subunit gamma n=1 Tax=Pseudomonas sp. B392_1p TaxID=3457507 RepID=UPI003FD46DBE